MNWRQAEMMGIDRFDLAATMPPTSTGLVPLTMRAVTGLSPAVAATGLSAWKRPLPPADTGAVIASVIQFEGLPYLHEFICGWRTASIRRSRQQAQKSGQ
jgi:hypothetical protein